MMGDKQFVDGNDLKVVAWYDNVYVLDHLL